MTNPNEVNWKINERTPPVPKLLFKYRDISNVLHFETLTELTIFLPSAFKFNDPFDCKVPLEYIQLGTDEELRRNFARKLIMMHGDEEKKNNIEEYVEKFIANKHLTSKEELLQLERNDKKKLNEFGIYSVSAISNNLLLWSHYANSHKGFCIGFNAKKLYDICKFDSLGPVTYFDKYPNMSVLRDNEDLYYNQLYNKSLDWYYEKEFRYIKINAANTKVKYNPDIVEEICIGCMASKETIAIIKQLRKEKYSAARLFMYKKSRKGYCLERDEI